MPCDECSLSPAIRWYAGNVLVGNVAAGSHRIGFRVVGSPLGMEECRTGHGPEAATLFADNVAHASLVGLLLEGAPGASCTGALNFAAWRNWDFGVLAGLEGIATSVLLEGVTAVDNRHAGVLVLKRGRNAEDHEANILGGLIQVTSRPADFPDMPGSHCRPCRKIPLPHLSHVKTQQRIDRERLHGVHIVSRSMAGEFSPLVMQLRAGYVNCAACNFPCWPSHVG